jgi:hypothetical protein
MAVVGMLGVEGFGGEAGLVRADSERVFTRYL